MAVIAVAGVAFAAGSKAHPSVKPDDLKWMQPFGPDGPNVAVVEGTFGNNKPCSFFAKFAAASRRRGTSTTTTTRA